MSAQTSRSTITYADGRRFVVRTHDRLARVDRVFDTDTGEDGITIAQFYLTGRMWLHRESGKVDTDSAHLADRLVMDGDIS